MSEEEVGKIPSVFASQIVNSFKVAQEQGLDDTFEAYYKHIMAVGDIKVEPKERERVAELQEGIDRYMDESQGGVLYSKENGFDPNTYFEQPEVIENIQKSKENFSEALDDLAWGQYSSKKKPIVLFKPTRIWTMVGLPDRKISFDISKIRKVIKEHRLTIDDLKSLPEKLANPEFIFESATDNVAYVGVLDRNNEPFVAIVMPVGNDLKVTNIIKSAYNKDSGFVNREINAGHLLYDKKNPMEFRRHRASFAQVFPPSDIDGNINQENENVNSKLYSINERGEERPYSNRELDKMLDNAEENKEALIDLYYNHRHKYLGRNGDRLETQVTNKYIGWGLEESNWSKERRRARWEKESRINDLKRRMANLKIPRELSPSALYRIFENSGYKILREYEANTGSYYLTVENPIEGEEDIHISIRDHWQHSADYVEPDYDIYIDRDYNWTRTILYMADELGLKDTLITKLRKYNDLKNELLGTEGIYYSEEKGEILGSYDYENKTIELFKGHNPSTLTHELGHHFIISHLNFMESIGANDKNKPVFEFLSGLANREINSVRDMKRPDHENLVEAFIDYMNIGQAPNIVTGNIFQRAKMVLKFGRKERNGGIFYKKRVLTKGEKCGIYVFVKILLGVFKKKSNLLQRSYVAR